jgi:hypothetical protein
VRLALLLLSGMVLSGGCGRDSAAGIDGPETPGEVSAPSPGMESMAVGYTYLRPDGNRLVEGQGNLPEARVLDIGLEGTPQWVVAAPSGRGSAWAVVLEDGRVQAFRVVEGKSAPVPIMPQSLPPGTPPVLVVEGGLRLRLANLLEGDASQLTHPAMLEGGRLAYVAGNGDLVLRKGEQTERLAVQALPDARLLADEEERLLLLSRPTTRYAHGVLGDGIEAAGMVLVETRPVLRAVAEVEFEAPLVGEGIAPLWADVEGDDRREVVVTLSDEAAGARLAVFSEEGRLLAEGAPVGQGFRWRQALAVALFAGGGQPELAAVRTPHLGGVVEFYRRAAGTLEVVTSLGGYTAHVPGSRNLDMAAAGDFDGDGRPELLLPDQERGRLGGIERASFGARVEWSVEVGGRMLTNLAATEQEGGGLLVGVGHDQGGLRIWLPKGEN